MDHNYIENELIVERFVTGDLEKEERRAFFEHCLKCRQCSQSVYIAGKIDDAIYRSKLGRKATAKTPLKKQNKTLVYTAMATLVVVAFVVGTLVTNKRTGNQPQMTEKQDIKTEEPTKPVTPATKNTTKPIEPKNEIKNKSSEPQPANREQQQPAPAPYENKPAENMAYTSIDYDLEEVNQVLNLGIDPKVATKGGTSDEDNSAIIIEELNTRSEYGSSELEIKTPGQGAKLDSGQPFEAKWHSQNNKGGYTLILIDSDQQQVISAYKNIAGNELRLQKGFAPGNYLMVVLEEATSNWHVVRFKVNS